MIHLLKVKPGTWIALAFILFGIQTSQAQLLMSLIFGDKLNSETLAFGIHLDQSWNSYQNLEDAESLRTFNLGLFFTYRINEHWWGNLEMLAKYKRGTSGLTPYALEDPELNELFEEGRVIREVNYLSLPMSMQYVTGFGGYLEAGPQISFRTRAKDIFETAEEAGQLELQVDIKDEVARWDFGGLAGIGCYFGKGKASCVGIRYFFGFTDVMKNQDGNQANSQWAIYAHLPMGR